MFVLLNTEVVEDISKTTNFHCASWGWSLSPSSSSWDAIRVIYQFLIQKFEIDLKGLFIERKLKKNIHKKRTERTASLERYSKSPKGAP